MDRWRRPIEFLTTIVTDILPDEVLTVAGMQMIVEQATMGQARVAAQIAATGRLRVTMARTASETWATSPFVQDSPPGRIRISADSGTNADRGRSGITLRPPMLTTVSEVRPMVFTENPKYPKPPDLRLAETQKLSDGELFWTIENGVRFTGMPAFAPPHGSQDDWKLVLFIRHLPQLTMEERVEMERDNPKGHH